MAKKTTTSKNTTAIDEITKSIDYSKYETVIEVKSNNRQVLISSSNSDEEFHKIFNISDEKLLEAFRLIITARMVDEKHLNYLKQGKSFFHIGGSGHEATQVAIGMHINPTEDWSWTYYRDLAYSLTLGLTLQEYFLQAFGKPEDPAAGGRQMPGHYGHLKLNMPTQSSPTGTQYLNAVGTAIASKKLNDKAIVYVSSGEGTTSQGEFYEAVNWATRDKLPVLFHIQDNGYAISVSREFQSMGADVTHSFSAYENLLMLTFDGSDFLASYYAAMRAEEYLRQGNGPVLLHSLVERLLPHSSSDDQKKYRPKEELERGRLYKDPIINLENYLLKHQILDNSQVSDIKEEIRKEIEKAAEWALSRPNADPKESTACVFAPLETRDLPYSEYTPQDTDHKIVMVDAINHALKEEMQRNPKMLIYGEDVADPKGGVFTATRGLTNEFGKDRVFNSPLAEASIIGTAIGLAVRGFKPVVEIQFGDYIWPAFMQLRDELATLRYRSNGNFSAPAVVRVAVGGFIHGGLYHSQNIEAFFAHIPGLLIAYPSSAAEAKGLLKTACRLQDPVIFLEHKGLYRLPFSSTYEPDENFLLPFGKGRIVRQGSDATIVSYGLTLKDSINAAKKFQKDTGFSVEVIDLRTILPWDKEIVINSVKKTNRLLICHEDMHTLGFGAEIAATISREAFEYLDAPVERCASKDSHIPYAPEYENDVLVTEDQIYNALQKLMDY
ncbi:MAG TPA: dehydrogenase E1 component subunit alpha/beta [Candidatus Kapabacteria bacterium]|nr:dehydrogenase E1 component subunit alpha/beta [Candidatus Kapabacteria bacterium]